MEQKGLSDIKAVGLYKNYDNLIDEKCHEEMCPKPALDVWIWVKNYYPIGTKIEREFKKNGIVRSAEVIDFDSDTTLYMLKWEEKNKDTEKKNSYTEQKIGLYLYLDELEKWVLENILGRNLMDCGMMGK